MASLVYNSAKAGLMNGSLDLDTDDLWVMLVDNTYPASALPEHDFRDDVTAFEISGTGYTAGGQQLASKTVTQDDVDDEGAFDAADVTWSGATFTARGAIVYKNVGTAATDNLVCFIDFGSDQTASGGPFSIEWNAEGILNLT